MPTFQIALTIKVQSLARSPQEVAKRVAAALTEAKFKAVSVAETVKKPPQPTTRAERLDAAMSLVSDARGQIEDLKSELEDWHGNLPENLQSSAKADDLQSAIDSLESIITDLDSAENNDVSFPSMM